MKHVTVRLNDAEVAKLQEIANTFKTSEELRKRCQVLLALDANHGDITPYEIIEQKYNISHRTIAYVKRDYREGGVEKVLERKKRVVSVPYSKEPFPSDVADKIDQLIQTSALTRSGNWSERHLKERLDECESITRVGIPRIHAYLIEKHIDLKALNARNNSERSRVENPPQQETQVQNDGADTNEIAVQDSEKHLSSDSISGTNIDKPDKNRKTESLDELMKLHRNLYQGGSEESEFGHNIYDDDRCAYNSRYDDFGYRDPMDMGYREDDEDE